MTRALRRAAWFVVLVALLAACSDEPEARPPQQVADASVLTPEDLPDGWDRAPHDPANDDLANQAAAFDDCLGPEGTSLDPTAFVSADSPDFSQGSGARQVKHTVSVMRPDLVTAAVENFLLPEAVDCLSEVIEARVRAAEPTDVRVVDVETERLALPRRFADSAALRTTLSLRVSGVELDVHLDNVLLGRGRLFSRFVFLSASTPFESELRDELLDRVAERLEEQEPRLG